MILEKLSTEESTHIVCSLCFLTPYDSDHLLYRAEAPIDVGDDALKAADGI